VLDRFAAVLPGWLAPVLDALRQPRVELALIMVSLLLFVGSVIGVPWLIVRLRADYFTKGHRDPKPDSVLGWVGLVGRNLFGIALFALGVLMLVLPGQGVLAIVAALLIMDFPGKHRLESWIVARPRVFKAVNALRRRAGKPPFESDAHAG
jgi:hypothetical protein